MSRFAPLFFFLAVWLPAQTKVQEETHGTINVILANKNGAVVVTDSRLSNGREPVGFAQKLFILDSRTVCAIAGFYNNFGAQFEQLPLPGHNQLRPIDVSVPGMIQTFIERARGSQTEQTSVSEKLQLLTEIYTFTLQVAADWTSNPGSLPSPAVLTVIGYQDGKLHVSGVKLQPYRVGRVLMYFPIDRIDQDLGDEFFNRIEGITAVSDEIKRDPPRFLKIPLKKGFAKAITGKGEGLDIGELEQTADDLEIETASRFPNLVGGPRQIAILEGGKVTQKSPEWPQPAKSGSSELVIIRNSTFSNGLGGITGMTSAIGTILFEAKLDHVVFQMDGKAFVSSDIDASTLKYDGKLATSLGISNRITNSRLLVGKGVAADDPFLKHVRADFPDMVIVQEK
jgi:hypothetical protein